MSNDCTTCTDLTPSHLQITQEVQLAQQVLLLSDTEAIDLARLRDEVQKCVLRTFGKIIYKDIWQHIDYTVKKQKVNIVLENIHRFRTKHCSDPLDLVYSIMSISIDGAKMRVEYGISTIQLFRNLFRFVWGDLCL